MARRNETDFQMPDDSGQVESPETVSTSEYGSTKRKRKGAFVPLTEDGQLDAARVKNPEVIEEIRAALAVAPAESAEKQHIDRALVGPLIDAYTVLIKQGSRLLKFPMEARELIAFDSEQRDAMTEPIGALLDKYAPALLSKNQELAAFLLVMGAQTQRSLMRAMVLYSATHAPAGTNGKAEPVHATV